MAQQEANAAPSLTVRQLHRKARAAGPPSRPDRKHDRASRGTGQRRPDWWGHRTERPIIRAACCSRGSGRHLQEQRGRSASSGTGAGARTPRSTGNRGGSGDNRGKQPVQIKYGKLTRILVGRISNGTAAARTSIGEHPKIHRSISPPMRVPCNKRRNISGAIPGRCCNRLAKLARR
jgi:hypothetical protein